MLLPGNLGFQTHLVLLLFTVALFGWMHQKWRNALARKEEFNRLVDMVSKESALTEFEAVNEYYYCHAVPRQHQCAVCFCPTTTRCSQCKSVRYCSGKCQIIHWRQGHKEECRPLTGAISLKQGSETSKKISEIDNTGSESLVDGFPSDELRSVGNGKSERSSVDIASDKVGTRLSSKEVQETELPPSKSTTLSNCVGGVSHTSKLNRMKSSHIDEGVDSKSQLPNGKTVVSDGAQPGKLGHKKYMRSSASSDALVADASNIRTSPSSSCFRLSSVTNEVENGMQLAKGKEARCSSFLASDHAQDACDGLRKSVWRKFQQFRSLKQSNDNEIIFPYDLFVKLYSCDEELYPFGLRNCGNSCYANAVLQCLAFTRPLTSYLVRGLHSNACRKKEWCFICEFQLLILKARGGESPLSPIRILSKIQKIGSQLGQGREEDAHEFLRYAVDTMQSVCLKEARAFGPLAEETTLVGLTFGGYLQSKITCMRCHAKSERFERIMDLTVEIDGDIGTLEEALMQFTAAEILDGENKYSCSRCKSYVKAKKKLSVLEAPNILTIVLKRFQSGNFGKLNKSVRFPEVLNLGPYMCGKSDKSAQYSLYGVVVHKDMMNSTSMGHYVCYVKDFRGEWFGINDSSVIPVELGRVLFEEAYLLLYARQDPRAPSLLRNNEVPHGIKSKKRNLEAVPSRLSTSKTRSNSHVPSTDPSKAQPKNDKHHYRMTSDNSTGRQLQDSDCWRYHNMQRVPPVDSSSESSSIFSWSDVSSCSTASTKDSVRSDDLSDFLFGEVGPSWYGHCGLSSDSVAPVMRQQHPGNDWR